LLVLTDRMSRKEMIINMAGKTAACTVRALDILQRRYGADFPRIFKTITVDNGCEFADVKGIEKDGRTQLYFCHPYSSWERGSNENLNKMIRRFVPKGFSINKVSRKQVHRIQTFMNSYPRKILGWRCADDVFYEAFLKEGINLTGYQKQ
ncbi:MAG: IS30 family transposase, partial [Ruthenibacterium lactatiformans]